MVGVELGRWYVIYSKPHRESTAQFHLQRKGVEVFFPRLLLPSLPLSRHLLVPLFPNYLFVRLAASEEYDYARWSPGVKCLVSFNGTPAPVDEEIVTFLKHGANADGILTADSSLTAGQEVRIVKGHFAGLIGIIQNPPDVRGRVKVLMQLLSRQVRVEVPVQCIEGGWVVNTGTRESQVA